MSSPKNNTILIFFGEQQNVFFLPLGGSEKIEVSSIRQFQAFSQFCNGKRKITYGEIRLADSFQMVFQFFLVHGRDGRNQKTASREVLH